MADTVLLGTQAAQPLVATHEWSAMRLVPTPPEQLAIFQIEASDGRRLICLYADGHYEGLPDDAPEAAHVFWAQMERHMKAYLDQHFRTPDMFALARARNAVNEAVDALVLVARHA